MNENLDKEGILTHDQLEQLAILYNVRLDNIFMLIDFLHHPKIGNFIINLDSDNRGGSHFVSIINLPNRLFYFCPYGVINKQLKEFLEEHLKKKVVYSNIKLQGLNEKNCGYWSLIALRELENVKTDTEFNKALEEMKYYKINFKNKK
jgi:hypothetical protein